MIMSMKNPNDSIEKQTHDLPACNTVPGKRRIFCEIKSKEKFKFDPAHAVQSARDSGNEASFILSLAAG
jgi:hypothetical protein